VKILIVAATHYEVAPLLKSFTFRKLEHQCLYEYSTHQNTIHVLITGIGIASTSYFLTKTLCGQTYDFALNAGICGSFKKEIPVGTTVRIVKDTIADLGIEDHESFVPAAKWLTESEMADLVFEGKNQNSFHYTSFTNIPKVTGITVNEASGSNSTIEKRILLFNPDTESMEGAAFMSICNNEKLNCEQVRTVSNFIEPRNEKAWNIPLAIKNLNDFLVHFINTELNIHS
jgi:futalosine hydrolase